MKNIKLKNEKEIYIMEENQELLVNNEELVTETESKMSGATGAILGSVLTIAAIAGVKVFKKMAAKRKLKKNDEVSDDDFIEYEEDFDDLADDFEESK